MVFQIAVIGAGSCDEKIAQKAFAVGEAIAKAGAVLLCGGLGGVMEAACKGAKSVNGTTIGIVPGSKRKSANRFVDIEIVTNAGQARNVFIAHSADAMVAVSGSYGTLSEISVGLKLGKPVVGIDTWDIEGVIVESDPKKAVEKAVSLI